MRKKLAIPEAGWPRAIGELGSLNHIEEAGVLSTCNSMEIYVVTLSWHCGVREVTEWMAKTSGIPVAEFRQHLFLLHDIDAKQHLFEVSAGLDSLVLGEGQILAQVKQVVKSGGVMGVGRNISGLFKHAITIGKRVQHETNIASGAVSVSSAAVELAIMKLPQDTSAFALAIEAVKQADATVLLVMLDLLVEAESLDRFNLSLPGNQTNLINQVTEASNGPVVLVILRLVALIYLLLRVTLRSKALYGQNIPAKKEITPLQMLFLENIILETCHGGT